MKMVYASKNGKLIFDDFVDDTAKSKTYYVGICTECLIMHSELLKYKHTTPADIGTCYVDGCQNEADFYIDFDPDEISFDMELEETIFAGKSRQISIVNDVSSCNCIGELQIEEDHINAAYELWFDVDKYFGENTRKDDSTWINFYTDWYPDGTITAVYFVESDDSSEEKKWDLTAEEKQFFFWKMEEYCQKMYGKSLRELWKEAMR